MSTTALGIAPDSDGNGVTPLTHRKVQQYQWASSGVCGGLEVSGGTGLTYTVSEGMAITTRGDSDGYSLAYYEGGTITTTAGNSSNPRYDVLWLSAHDISQGDEDNLVTLGITNGTAAASPSVPSVGSDCTIIDILLVPAGMTATSSCTSTGDIDYAIPYGASLGILASTSKTTSGSVISTSGTKVGAVSFSVPTDRWVDFTLDHKMTIASGDYTTYSSIYVDLYIDGTCVTDGTDEILVPRVWVRDRTTFTQQVSAGSHSAYFYIKANPNATYQAKYGGVMDAYIYDRGVAE